MVRLSQTCALLVSLLSFPQPALYDICKSSDLQGILEEVDKKIPSKQIVDKIAGKNELWCGDTCLSAQHAGGCSRIFEPSLGYVACFRLAQALYNETCQITRSQTANACPALGKREPLFIQYWWECILAWPLWKSLSSKIKEAGGMARGYEHLLLMQRTWVRFPAWWFTTICNFSSRVSNFLSDLCRLLHAHGIHMYMQA